MALLDDALKGVSAEQFNALTTDGVQAMSCRLGYLSPTIVPFIGISQLQAMQYESMRIFCAGFDESIKLLYLTISLYMSVYKSVSSLLLWFALIIFGCFIRLFCVCFTLCTCLCLCCAVLWCSVLCCIVLCCDLICCCCNTLCCAMLVLIEWPVMWLKLSQRNK